jgi:hypothetical protein
MFPFRPSRAATALLELAEAMLAPDAFEAASNHGAPADVATTSQPAPDAPHPHRRRPAVDRRRRPAPPKHEQACLTPLTRAARDRDQRTALHS